MNREDKAAFAICFFLLIWAGAALVYFDNYRAIELKSRQDAKNMGIWEAE